LGETGLDYHYDNSPRDVQRRLLDAHIDVAVETGLPLVLHSRSAEADTAAAVRAAATAGASGVLHCFSGSGALLDAALETGWYVSFAGLITFKRFEGADLLRAVPGDRLLIETDSPYLAPVPQRGRRNEPAFVAHTCAAAAALRGESPAELARSTMDNARRFLNILPDTLANQIAAGEVVERPASVVKELVENALDAGATRVEIELATAARQRSGSPTTAGHGARGRAARAGPARDEQDRAAGGSARVRTFGFRGEALPSIASVSRLTVETAEPGGVGTRVRVAGGRIQGVEDCARQGGTTITVRSLFMNVPARAAFLRSAAVETRGVAETVVSLALANLSTAFLLESNGRTLLELASASDLPARASPRCGATRLPLSSCRLHELEGMQVSGLAERPDASLSGPRRSPPVR
jgi:hypothetical protein